MGLLGGGAYHKDSKYLCSSFAVKAGGGLHSKGAYFRVSTVVGNYSADFNIFFLDGAHLCNEKH